MSPSPNESGDGDPSRAEAADWFARMRGPDADRHRVAFEAWLDADPGHLPLYDRMVLRWQQAELLSHTQAGQGREGLPQRSSARSIQPWLALAACLVAVVAIGITVWLWSGQRGGSESSTEIASSAVSSPMGIRRVRLRDGSIVTLDTETSLTLRMTDEERRIVLISGRARFEVAHDAARPFIVSAGDSEVVAIGTMFDVSLTSGQPHVSLLKGSVEVRMADAGAAQARVVARLSPGQAISLGGAVPAPQPALPAEAAWASGMLVFEDAPLDQVLTAANRYSARKVRIDEAGLGTLLVTGSFRANRPHELAATLAAAFQLEVEQQGRDLLLHRSSHGGQPGNAADDRTQRHPGT